jgi:hypothetical protein
MVEMSVASSFVKLSVCKTSSSGKKAISYFDGFNPAAKIMSGSMMASLLVACKPN